MTQLDLDGLNVREIIGRSIDEQMQREADQEFMAMILRDAGIAATLAAEHDAWLEHAINLLREFGRLKGEPFTIDEFRQGWDELGYRQPHAGSVWGAMTKIAHQRGLIRPTGQWIKSKRPSAHARYCQLWEAV